MIALVSGYILDNSTSLPAASKSHLSVATAKCLLEVTNRVQHHPPIARAVLGDPPCSQKFQNIAEQFIIGVVKFFIEGLGHQGFIGICSCRGIVADRHWGFPVESVKVFVVKPGSDAPTCSCVFLAIRGLGNVQVLRSKYPCLMLTEAHAFRKFPHT